MKPDSLWSYLATLPGSFNAQLLYALIISGTVGMIANYTVKWARGDIEGSLAAYLFTSHVRSTLLSLFGFVSLAVTSIAAGVFTADHGAFVGWTNVLWFGLTNGFAVDAIANKGRRSAWSDDKRTEKLGSQPTKGADAHEDQKT